MDLKLTYGKNSLPESVTRQLIDYARNKLNVPPSYLITLLNYESFWGGSNVGQSNNNWGGMTWNSSWTNPQKRKSGVTVSRGSARPSNEGGYYIKYNSVSDFIIDWTYLLRRGGIYKVADSSIFDLAIKGMFKYGGATYDYAIMGVSTSKQRYELYLQNMKARRNSINNANDGALDKIDNGDDGGETIPLPDDTWDKPSLVEDIKDKTNDMKNKLQNGYISFSNAINDMLSVDLVKYGNSFFMSNNFLTLQKVSENKYKIKANISLDTILDIINTETNQGSSDITGEVEDLTEPKNPQIPPQDEEEETGKGTQPTFPTTPGLRISSKYGPRIPPKKGASAYHMAIDISGGGKEHPIYATQNGEIVNNSYSSSGGNTVILKHNYKNDNYYSRYLHLKARSPLSVGTQVKAGDTIATMGSTGISTGIHLDFAISENNTWGQNGKTINPEKYLRMYF